jgi:hypothetical protein
MITGYSWDAPIVNCTFVGNSGGYTGWSPPNSTAKLRNTVVSGDGILNTGAASEVILAHTIVWDTPLGNGYDGSSVNVITEDPQFVDGVGGNYRPRHGGPAIDAGDNALVYGSFDVLGGPRVVDGNRDKVATVDIGAYEQGEAPPVGSMVLIR